MNWTEVDPGDGWIPYGLIAERVDEIDFLDVDGSGRFRHESRGSGDDLMVVTAIG